MPQVQPPIHSVTDLTPGDHACRIYDTDKEHRNIVTPFLLKGPGQNENVSFELSDGSIIYVNFNGAQNGTGNNKQDEITSAVKNL